MLLPNNMNREKHSFVRGKRSRSTLKENTQCVKHARRREIREIPARKRNPRANPPSLDFFDFKPIERFSYNDMNKSGSRHHCAKQDVPNGRVALKSDTISRFSVPCPASSKNKKNASNIQIRSPCRNNANITTRDNTAACYKRACHFTSELPPRARACHAHLRRCRPRRRKTWRSKSGFDAEAEEDEDVEQQDEVKRMPGTVSPESVFDHPPVQSCRHARRCPFPQQRGLLDSRRMRIDKEEVTISVDDGGVEMQEMDHDYALMKNNLMLKQLHWMRVLRLQRQRAQDERLREHAQKTNAHFVDEEQQRSCELLHQLYIEKLRRKS